MIPIIKGNEPKALTEAKRDIQNTPDTSFDYSSLRGDISEKSSRLSLLSRGICAHIACAESAPTTTPQRSSI